MPPKAARGRKKGVSKQKTLDKFVESNHGEEDLSTKIAENSNDDEVTNNGIMKIEKNSTNSESTTEQESLQVNGVENTESEDSKSKEIPIDDAKIEASVENENTATEEISEVKENTSKKNVPTKRGRKQENDLDNGNKESSSEAPVKRSRRNKPENSDTADESKEKVDGNFEAPKENIEQDKRKRAGRNKKQNNKASVVEEAPKVGRKRKNIEQGDTQENKNKSETSQSDVLDTNTVLKVSIQRDEELDRRSREEAEKAKSAKGSKKPATKGKRARSDDSSVQDSDSKPAKVPKETSKSKGQSKKDKMPDVTQLDFKNTSKSPDGQLWNLKLSSWNVNGVRAWLEKDGLAYLHHESPDVLCVQETKCSDDKLPEEVKVEGYHSYWLAGDKDGYSGVGLLSKVKPISVKYGIDITEHDTEGRVITAEYDNFFLVTAYVPNAGRGLVRLNYRMQWDKDFLSYLKSLDEKKPVVLCGDLNVAHEEIDLSNPKTNKKNAGFTKEEREGFSTLLSEGNFIDTFRHLYPDQKAAYTFWTYMMNARAKNVGWRLDYFIISKRFTDHLCDHAIRKDVFGSDHCPITLFLSV